MAATHALYRFYGDAGTLLYVGITNSPQRRFGQHAKGKDWWPEVRGISIDWYETRVAVEAAERRAINVEQPVYNKALRRRAVPLPKPSVPLFSAGEVDLMESVECAWTAFWWDDPASVNQTNSRYRHDGRRYAPQPEDWRAVVADLYWDGLTEAGAFEAIRAVRAGNAADPTTMTPDVMWQVFVELARRETPALT